MPLIIFALPGIIERWDGVNRATGVISFFFIVKNGSKNILLMKQVMENISGDLIDQI